ncbi:hypothetical protein LPY66_07060 [Dehalobacter sp. DCM]|uniref:hypothetical protein n=1 Tax=Dehalobacter sp. DCM TaxID=2907827 RepID=UPI00308149C8|nr:hypothetical protein LPY66_07060 [Dehalobacter sp. DCM]
MKKKNVIILSSIIIILLLSGITILSKTGNNSVLVSVNNKNTIYKNTSSLNTTAENKDVVLDLRSELDYLINTTDKNVRNENSDFIIIGTVQSVDGGINYNPKRELYTEIQTIGNLNVEKIIKGNVEDNIIPFMRLGGVISFSEYEKGLTESQKAKVELTKTLTNEEKKTKYVSSNIMNNINIEQGKTYLMYLKYDPDYGRYAIVFLQDGLREIDKSTMAKSESKKLNKDEMSMIKVKNNETEKFETISEVLGDL